ncbi:MAG: ABC-type cobalamin/Fe3+-siderophores transport system, ATPase component [Burkholderiaceae bacterium]|nr:ABC-type cobalamin/Fe3+-siderophores transport system, ATPase component [Burkholderiaceae bacterium]
MSDNMSAHYDRPLFGYPMIDTQSLQLRIAGRTLVDQLEWQAKPGECWCVIGRNGAGKTTLLRTLAGLRQPDGGRVRIDGRPLPQWPPLQLARQRAFLPQAKSDAFGYRAIDTVLAARYPFHAGSRWESDSDHEAALAALQAVGAAGLAQRDVRTLSGGERQRVAIASLLAQDAALMLLDEPANALDLAHQASTMALLSRLCREQQKTVLMAVHDLNLVYGIATHALLLMGDGQWQAGPVAGVMTAELLGRCLGHPVELVPHHGRVVYVAAPCA